MEPHTHTESRKAKCGRFFEKNSVPVAIVIAGLLIAGAVIFNGKRTSGAVAEVAPSQADQANPSAKPANIDEIKTAGNPFIGDPKAPVVVAYWYDYQCPFCKKAESDIFPQLINDYVNSGKVKVVFKGYPILGDDSHSAALAERGIWELAPNLFYKWHEQMFEKQDAENSGWGNRKDIVALAKSVGIDSTKLDALVVAKSADYQKALQADMDEGQSYGVTGTPTFMIGKKLIVGAVPYPQIKAAIEDVLAGK